MATHYVQSSESRQALCGRKNPNSAIIGGWDGVTCKHCLKRKLPQTKGSGVSLGGIQEDLVSH